MPNSKEHEKTNSFLEEANYHGSTHTQCKASQFEYSSIEMIKRDAYEQVQALLNLI